MTLEVIVGYGNNNNRLAQHVPVFFMLLYYIYHMKYIQFIIEN